MARSATISVRVDHDIRAKAAVVLNAAGLSVSDAARILFGRIAADQALPPELKVPNRRLQAAIRESRNMARTRRARFDSVEALIEDIEASRRR